MFHPVPQVPYDRFKGWIVKHKWLHYMMHMIWCTFTDSINGKLVFYTPSQWIEYHDEKYPPTLFGGEIIGE